MRSENWSFLGDSVPSARDPEVDVVIKPGVHEVIFDDVISRNGNGSECDIFNMSDQTRQRILVETLGALERGQRASPYNR